MDINKLNKELDKKIGNTAQMTPDELRTMLLKNYPPFLEIWEKKDNEIFNAKFYKDWCLDFNNEEIISIAHLTNARSPVTVLTPIDLMYELPELSEEKIKKNISALKKKYPERTNVEQEYRLALKTQSHHKNALYDLNMSKLKTKQRIYFHVDPSIHDDILIRQIKKILKEKRKQGRIKTIKQNLHGTRDTKLQINKSDIKYCIMLWSSKFMRKDIMDTLKIKDSKEYSKKYQKILKYIDPNHYGKKFQEDLIKFGRTQKRERVKKTEKCRGDDHFS